VSCRSVAAHAVSDVEPVETRVEGRGRPLPVAGGRTRADAPDADLVEHVVDERTNVPPVAAIAPAQIDIHPVPRRHLVEIALDALAEVLAGIRPGRTRGQRARVELPVVGRPGRELPLRDAFQRAALEV